MELQEVRIAIDKDGNVRVDVNGVKGMKCLDVTRALEAALGDNVEHEMTAEAYEQEQELELENRDWLQGGR